MAEYRRHSAGPIQFQVDVHKDDGSRENVRVRNVRDQGGDWLLEAVDGSGRMFRPRSGLGCHEIEPVTLRGHDPEEDEG
jgi:hypothetical protein